MNADDLIKNPEELPPHVVLLGAGASRAAFPDGDGAGNRVPVMDDLVEIAGLGSCLSGLDIGDGASQNFEVLYSRLLSDPALSSTRAEVERQIEHYFSSMSLPPGVTLYDRLLVCLRPVDAVFTFNWDPFLFDAFQRNRHAVQLPEIFFLHGNVRIAACPEHDRWGARGLRCPDCANPLSPVPLLYPIEEKRYTDSPFLARNWGAARELFRSAFTLTVFGYGAPDSDVDAVKLLHAAWMERADQIYQHIEIIDIGDSSQLVDRWLEFSPDHHYLLTRTFDESRIARWPRRSCEALRLASRAGEPSENFPMSQLESLEALQSAAATIASAERSPA
jgi:hypothetical protein